MRLGFWDGSNMLLGRMCLSRETDMSDVLDSMMNHSETKVNRYTEKSHHKQKFLALGL